MTAPQPTSVLGQLRDRQLEHLAAENARLRLELATVEDAKRFIAERYGINKMRELFGHLANSNPSFAGLIDETKASKARVADLEAELARLQEERKQATWGAIGAATKGVVEYLFELQNEAEAAKARVAELEAERDALVAKVDDVSADHRAAFEVYTRMRAQLSHTQTQLAAADVELANLADIRGQLRALAYTAGIIKPAGGTG